MSPLDASKKNLALSLVAPSWSKVEVKHSLNIRIFYNRLFSRMAFFPQSCSRVYRLIYIKEIENKLTKLKKLVASNTKMNENGQRTKKENRWAFCREFAHHWQTFTVDTTLNVALCCIHRIDFKLVEEKLELGRKKTCWNSNLTVRITLSFNQTQLLSYFYFTPANKIDLKIKISRGIKKGNFIRFLFYSEAIIFFCIEIK
ncbi:hypothetical protein BpHYR1_035068 [Brachionus plicatilis]|uniref:Uncharacterized protein n=1 Tax=Brachionus plicatilis TaxID=10195 RepID=A0A3M7SZQ6_BRAPC|nr:hypothetical protein BpHYR1_035068 [Brachionus plicatilis]